LPTKEAQFNHGLLIGLLAGLVAIAPYVGSLTGLLLSVAVAILQFGLTWTPILLILGIFFIGQTIADYALAPSLVGKKVHLNPVWMIFALFAFGYLFGFVGLLIAVPMAASIGVLVRFSLKNHLTKQVGSNASADFGQSDPADKFPRPPPLQ
jgi:predicted PurR-regulated permease PerM